MSRVRMLAASVIDEVMQGNSLTTLLEKQLVKLSDARDRALVQAITFGVCRYYTQLAFIAKQLMEKPLPKKESSLYALILVGLYQLADMRIPPHAALSETVNATVELKKKWARGLVNAILRRYLREKNQLDEAISKNDEACYAHPAWWLTALQQAYPDQWQVILHANNAKPPMVLRVNHRQLSREAYLSKLTAMSIMAHAVSDTATGISLAQPVPINDLPDFAAGNVSVQDGAPQLAVALLDLPSTPCRILDACAAPGGKLTHILECVSPGSTVVAVEKNAARQASIDDNLQRLQLSATCFVADVADTAAWWDGQLFDRILLDAPCSASGVIRRHPDIKLLRQAEDIPAQAALQATLLAALWPLVTPGGMLLYATCSVLPDENEKVVLAFLETHQDAKEEVIVANWGQACDVGRQLLPGGDFDGFYYAKLRKAN